MNEYEKTLDKALTNVYRDIAILYDLARDKEELNDFDKKVLDFINLEHYNADKKLRSDGE